jgi:hypothetical protein
VSEQQARCSQENMKLRYRIRRRGEKYVGRELDVKV